MDIYSNYRGITPPPVSVILNYEGNVKTATPLEGGVYLE